MPVSTPGGAMEEYTLKSLEEVPQTGNAEYLKELLPVVSMDL